MSSSSYSFEIPKRLSLAAQAAAAIRKAIEDGAWQDYLPNERRLCELLQVSRPTIRTALHIVAKEGLIGIHQGRRNRLLPFRRITARPESRLVAFVTREPISQLTVIAYQGVSAICTNLAGHGFTTEFLVCSARSARDTSSTCPRRVASPSSPSS